MIENRIKYDLYSTFPESNGQLERCRYCNRTFHYNSLKRHQLICYRNTVKHQETPPKVLKQFKSSDIEYIKISELLNRKKKRRNQWRNDHLNLIKQLEISQEPRNYSRNLSAESSSGDMLSWDISNFSVIEEPYLEWKSLKVTELPIQDNTNYKTSQHHRRNSSKHIKDISEQLSNLKANERKNFYETRLNCPPSLLNCTAYKQFSLSSKDLSKFSNGIEISSNLKQEKTKLYKSNNDLNKFNDNCANVERSFQQQAIHRYEQNIKKVLQLYSEKYWLNENKTQQNVLENIPKNLSIQRQKLEKLKQFHSERKLNNHINKMLSVSTNNIFEDSKKKLSKDEIQQFAFERSESNLEENKRQQIKENLSKRFPCEESAQNCNCGQLKSILKTRERDPLIKDRDIKIQSTKVHNRDPEPYTNPKLNRFKQHLKSMNNFNSHSTLQNEDCQKEKDIKTNQELCTANHSVVNDIKSFTKDLDPSLAGNQKSTYGSQNQNDYIINDNQTKQTNHYENQDLRQISLKSCAPSKKVDKINDTIVHCETSNLKEAYAKSWKVKL